VKIEEDSAMTTYSIGDLSRREILRMSSMLGVTSVVSTKFAFAQAALQRTPGQILGPFYPVKPFDQNADLTKVPGRPGRAEGEILNVMGRVLNLKGEPVRNAKVEVWQANAHGRYTLPAIRTPRRSTQILKDRPF
jgi:protocatechuate 3,4-dioxygenase beta subunit